MKTKLKITRARFRLSPKRLTEFEEQLGAKLPVAYRNFLLQYNGGEPDPACFPCKAYRSYPWITHFYSVDKHLATPNEDADYDTISFIMERWGTIIPKGSLIIGQVVRDDLLVLPYDGPRRGKVYVKQLERLPFPPNEQWEKKPWLGTALIAPSFSHFLKMLRPDREADEE